jgi:hypothetical protein
MADPSVGTTMEGKSGNECVSDHTIDPPSRVSNGVRPDNKDAAKQHRAFASRMHFNKSAILSFWL